MAASTRNQFRIHAGYHYLRSPKTIREVLDSRKSFISEYIEAVIGGLQYYYVMPKSGSRILLSEYIEIMGSFGLPLRDTRPDWMGFSFIESCWEVEEELYSVSFLRKILEDKLSQEKVTFHQKIFDQSKEENNYEHITYATELLRKRQS